MNQLDPVDTFLPVTDTAQDTAAQDTAAQDSDVALHDQFSPEERQRLLDREEDQRRALIREARYNAKRARCRDKNRKANKVARKSRRAHD